MKTYNSMYLGICINNNDPERRGRVQIFIPQIMPALYKNWNEDGQDIEITCVGDNIPQGLKSEVVDRLRKILPWAEAASPIVGTSAPGNVVSRAIDAAASAVAAGANAVAGAVSAATQQVGNLLDQSPTGEPPCIGDLNALLDEASKYAGNDAFGRQAAASYKGNRGGHRCGRGSHGVLGALTGGKIPGGSLGGNANDFGAGGSMDFTKSGLYNPKVTPPANYMNDPSQWKVGDVVANGGGGQGYGHIQVWTGKAWVSDFTQNRILQNSNYHSFALHRPNAAGDAVIGERMSAMNGSQPSSEKPVCERPSISGTSPSAPVQAQTTPPNLQEGAASESYGNAANQQITNQAGPTAPQQGAITPSAEAGMTGTVSGKSTATPGVSKEALEYAMRMAAAESGAGVQPSKAVLGEIADPLVSLGYSAKSYGVKVDWNQRHSYAQVREYGKQVTQTAGFNPNKMDIGYTQHNNNDAAAYNLKNSGTYKEQILSVAQHVQNQMNKKPEFAAALQSGRFADGDKMNAIPGWNITPNNVGADKYNRYFNAKASLSDRINKEFGGDPYAALEALDKENPATASANEMLGTNYAPPTAGSGQGYAGSTGQSAPTSPPNTNMVQNTDKHGPIATQNLNGVAKGLFTYPAAGAMLWCFFREGNPLFPVYFAASYSQSEWASVYKTGSPGPGYNPAPKPGEAQSTGGMMNLNGVGGLRWEDTHNPEDRSQDQKSIMLFGEDGSNMFMGKGYHQLFSKFDRRDQVEGDRWNTTLGSRESWVQGDSNDVVMGDVFIKIGNVSATATEAVEKIHQLIKEIQAPLAQSEGGGGGGGSSAASGSASTSKTSEALPPELQKAIDDKKIINKLAPDPGAFKLQTENKVPAYLQAGASQSTIDQFRKDSNALQAGRNALSSSQSFTPQLANSSSSMGSNLRVGGSSMSSFTNASTVSQSPKPASSTPTYTTSSDFRQKMQTRADILKQYQ